MEKKVGQTKIYLMQGDITKQSVDAIVNAANSSLMGGGGVDGAIHRAGGPAILEACKKIVAKQGRCPTGQAVITTGGNLAAQHVIHTVGPIWSGGNRNEHELLANCYRNCLLLSHENACKSVAFPSISTGAYRFPIDQAARIALNTIAETVPNLTLNSVVMVLFSNSDLQVYQKALEQMLL